MTYPNGRELEYSYGGTNSLNNRMGRLASTIGNPTMRESYWPALK